MTETINYRADEYMDRCPICKSEEFIKVYDRGVFYSRIEELTEVVSVLCEGCGVVFNNPRVRYDNLLSFYESLNDYVPDYKSVAKLIDKPESDKTKQRISMIADYLQPGIKVLELGGGNLNFASSLAKSRPDISVHELEPSLEEDFKPLDNLELFKGLIDSRNEHSDIGQEFDIVVALHVLEHQCDPVTFLKQLKNMINKNGILFLELPNLYTPFYLKKNIDLFFRAVHLFNYSKKSLDLALRKAGFEPVLWSDAKPTVIQVIAKRLDDGMDEMKSLFSSPSSKDIKKYISRWSVYSRLKRKIGENYLLNVYAKISWALFNFK